MTVSSSVRSSPSSPGPIWHISGMRARVWIISGVFVSIALIGLVLCWINPEIGAPLRPGLDFTGGTQIQLERRCGDRCAELKTSEITRQLVELEFPNEEGQKAPNLSNFRIQLLEGGESLMLRMPTLSAAQGQALITAIADVAGPLVAGGQSVDTSGTTLMPLLALILFVCLG